MKIKHIHNWNVTAAEAKEIQRKLAGQILRKNELTALRFIAGVDISAPDSEGFATGAAVVLSYPSLEAVEIKVVKEKLGFPYVPGLLSFRESPVIIAACQKLEQNPDLMLVDGQGLAHPRRIGLASHLGLILNIPTIGCAKSLLCGNHGALGTEPGSYSFIRDNQEIIGAALCTKLKSKPIYVSIGHKIDLETAIFRVIECCRGYRLPEPTRLAHLAAAGKLTMKTTQGGHQGKLL